MVLHSDSKYAIKFLNTLYHHAFVFEQVLEYFTVWLNADCTIVTTSHLMYMFMCYKLTRLHKIIKTINVKCEDTKMQ